MLMLKLTTIQIITTIDQIFTMRINLRNHELFPQRNRFPDPLFLLPRPSSFLGPFKLLSPRASPMPCYWSWFSLIFRALVGDEIPFCIPPLKAVRLCLPRLLPWCRCYILAWDSMPDDPKPSPERSSKRPNPAFKAPSRPSTHPPNPSPESSRTHLSLSTCFWALIKVEDTLWQHCKMGNFLKN